MKIKQGKQEGKKIRYSKSGSFSRHEHVDVFLFSWVPYL